MTFRENDKLLNELVDSLDLPNSAYEKAIDRYEDIGEWLGRDGSSCAMNEPHIFSQGSFRLGIAIRPLSGEEEYDLDLACNLRKGISSNTHTQKELKDLLGAELELYRKARNINSPLEPKHRCWRLEYADNLKFHMDIVPCIPEDEIKRKSLAVAMEHYGLHEDLAHSVSELAVGITDDRLPNYTARTSDWMISNPEGYALWFEKKMSPNILLKAACESAQIDEVPVYKKKAPLQRVIQILKRHRDQMFVSSPDSKPISVIITTLSASFYRGSDTVEDTLNDVLAGLKQFIASDSDEVQNPVNPSENFADRWKIPSCRHLKLKESFHQWVEQVNKDFEFILNSDELEMISESISKNLSISTDQKQLEVTLGLVSSPDKSSLLRIATAASASTIHNVSFADSPRVPKKPEGFA